MQLTRGTRVTYQGKEYHVFSVMKTGVLFLDSDKNDVTLDLKTVETKLANKELVVLK